MAENRANQGVRITWGPPNGEFVVSPSLAELETAILQRGAEFWGTGSCDGGLFFDRNSEAEAELILMFAAPDKFCVLHQADDDDTQYCLGTADASDEMIVVRQGGNPWRLPARYFVPRSEAWEAVQFFVMEGRRSPKVRWTEFDPPDLE